MEAGENVLLQKDTNDLIDGVSKRQGDLQWNKNRNPFVHRYKRQLQFIRSIFRNEVLESFTFRGHIHKKATSVIEWLAEALEEREKNANGQKWSPMPWKDASPRIGRKMK